MSCKTVNPNSKKGLRYAAHAWVDVIADGHPRQRCSRCAKLNPVGIPPEIRFWDHVEKGPGCWIWKADVNNYGYGRFTIYGAGLKRNVLAHRYAWELVNGQIPADKEMDHLCREVRCVRPNHLDVVPHRVNLERRPSHGKCKKGHPITGPNRKVMDVYKGRERVRCRICYEAYQRVLYPEVNCSRCGYRLYGRGKVKRDGEWVCRSQMYCDRRKTKVESSGGK